MTTPHDAFPLSSRFAEWCLTQENKEILLHQDPLFRAQALQHLVYSINSGQITSLDGVQSPLSLKIKQHHQLDEFEMNSNWIGSAQDWICPCCHRTKFQISRVGKKRQILAKLTIHHDHMSEALKEAFHTAFVKAGTDKEQVDGLRFIDRLGKSFSAYDEILICEDCNNADSEAKKYVNAPDYFSFSISQIEKFITVLSHQSHLVDENIAHSMWALARPAFNLRMKIINAVAHAAVTDSHWLETYPLRFQPIPVFGFNIRPGDLTIKKWVSELDLLDALNSKNKNDNRNLSRWRVVPPPLGKRPPKNFLAMLRSEYNHGKAWDSLDDDWLCPICKRNKFDIINVNSKGKVCFKVSIGNYNRTWIDGNAHCMTCKATLLSLKWELVQATKNEDFGTYEFVKSENLTNIIIPRPHSSHLIKKFEAETLFEKLIEKYSN